MPKVICPTISVRNMEESVRFYTGLLHFSVKRRMDGAQGVTIVFLEDEEHNLLELIEHPQTGQSAESGKVSILLGVAGLAEISEELKAHDVQITRGPIEAPGGMKFVFIRDPNGIELELMEGFEL